jgi:predicted membrane protein
MIFATPGAAAGPPGLVFGILLILAGVMFFLDNLGIVHIGNIWEYWPLVLIAVGVSKLYSCRGTFGQTWAIGLIAIGALFLAGNMGFLHVDFNVIWPLALIAWGILMLAKSQGRAGWTLKATFPRPADQAEISDEILHEFSFFGGVKRVIHSQNFQGGELVSAFGGIEIDLRAAGLARTGKPIVIDANASFGGINIKVPDTWRVAVRGVGVFGGYEDKTFRPRQLDETAPLLVITGYAAFGGVVVE